MGRTLMKEGMGIKKYLYILLVEMKIAAAFEGQSDMYYEKLSKRVSLIYLLNF